MQSVFRIPDVPPGPPEWKPISPSGRGVFPRTPNRPADRQTTPLSPARLRVHFPCLKPLKSQDLSRDNHARRKNMVAELQEAVHSRALGFYTRPSIRPDPSPMFLARTAGCG